MSAFSKTLVATFDATAMAIFALIATRGRFDDASANLVLWGSAAAAALAAMVVATRGPATIAWVAIGYIVFAALLAVDPPQLIVLTLAVALMPVVPQPRGSLALGLAIAAGAALAIRTLLPLFV